MANEIVKYKNQINKVSLRSFNSKELDIFMEIISRMRNKDTNEVVFDFWYLKKLINWNDTSSISFEKALKNVYDKLIQCNFSYEDKKEYVKFVLFTMYKIDYDNKTITVKINNDFKPLLNFVTGNNNYTRFELEEFVKFKSTYTKEFFRRMKQYNLGFWEVDLVEFKDMLDIPKTYNSCDIDKRVLTSINEELKDTYNLKIIKKYAKHVKRGRPSLIGYRFEFNRNISSEDSPITEIKDYQIGKYNFSQYIDKTLIVYQPKNPNEKKDVYRINNIFIQNGKIKMELLEIVLEKSIIKTFDNEKHLMNFIQKFIFY